LRSDHCLGPNGILAEIDAEGTDEPIIAIASTVPASFVQTWPARAHALGKRVTFFDIPVTGAEKTAVEETLMMHGGGEKAVFDRCRPAMDAVAREVLHVGDLVAGQVTKLAIVKYKQFISLGNDDVESGRRGILPWTATLSMTANAGNCGCEMSGKR